MNIEQIRLLAEVMGQSGLTGIEVSESGVRIRLEKYPWQPTPAEAPGQMTGRTLAVTAQEAPRPSGAEQVVDFNRLTEVKSPMVGIFHSAPAPGSPPFVTRGSRVKKGDVLCIIEAMKMMNEITAAADGEVVDICAENGQLVEFSQVLFKLF